ncbi:hypothetical protein [Hydrogenoanaerobacterium sp.]|uniref:hypothetical protein n=1 Tax=Hydrogenoanaerobacterium sp. TaxID=2953763 RepID=UPI00289F4E8F|nr:hypothetical protein [Hydrogenoanaerobacterium sp.]
MSILFPTSKDIYIEINGRRLAVAQGYKAKSSRESRYVEAFGSEQPVGTVGGRLRHILELSRVCATKDAMGGNLDFHSLSGFNVVIVKPDRQIIYSGCEWGEIQEVASLGEVVLESVTIVAGKRMELL